MRRRELLLSLGASAVAGSAIGRVPPARVMTVRGWVEASRLGVTLAHEHALASFQPDAERRRAPIPYDRDEVVAVVLPRLQRLKALGCRTFIDATAVGLGRDPVLLRRLSEASGLHILTTTGAYAAMGGQFLPPDIETVSVEALAQRWIDEWRKGIEGSGVRPGFIKLGFNGGPLSSVEDKLIRAGVIAHRATGLTIGAHTGPAVSAFAQLAILHAEGIDPSAWIWIHAQQEPDSARHVEAARLGAWVEFDGIDPQTLERHADFVTAMKAAGVLGRTLISQDAGWYEVGKPLGGSARSYEVLFTAFVPALKARGFTAADIDQLLIANPARAFAVGVRANKNAPR